MMSVSLQDALTLKAALQQARTLPRGYLLREQLLAELELKQQLYIDQLVLENAPEDDLALIELRSI